MLRRAVVLVALVCLGLGTFVGYAYSSQGGGGKPGTQAAGTPLSHQPGPQSHDFPALRAGAPISLMVMTQNDALTVSSPPFVNFTADTITIPATGKFRAVVRFSAESACSAVSWCTARITVGGVEANPKSGSDFAFDSPGGETWQGLTMDRTSDIIVGTGSPRAVTIALDVGLVGGGSWRLDDWSVVTELYRVS